VTRNGPAFETSTIGHEQDWRNRAECLNHDAELWFPLGIGSEATRQAEMAKAWCNQVCEVRAECDRWADENNEQSGIWGGLTEQERSTRRRRRSRERAAAADRRRAEEQLAEVMAEGLPLQGPRPTGVSGPGIPQQGGIWGGLTEQERTEVS
jgi:WhiB family redox-sensing transcriptional regulator